MVEDPEERPALSTVVRVAVDLKVMERIGIEKHVGHGCEARERGTRVDKRRR